MKWFKHDSNASLDAKLKRVRLKYGMEGYGLYWYCLELIAQSVEKHNLTFELEHDAEIIAADTNIHQDVVQSMMVDFADWGLFENNNGAITCLKMATRTDEYTQKLINKSVNVPTLSRQSPRKSELIEENRIEENRSTGKKSGRFTPPTLQEVRDYIQAKGYNVDAERFCNFYESKNWMVGKNKMKKWTCAIANWNKSNGSQPNGLNSIGKIL